MTPARIIVLGSAALLLVGLVASSAGQSSKSTVWDGVYSDAQARRGADVYDEHCVQCHAEDLSGDTSYNPSPQLVGRPFMLRWEGRHLDELFARICATMPANKPGILKPQQCADVMAFMFKRNRFPSAGTEVSADAEALSNIEMTLEAPKK